MLPDLRFVIGAVLATALLGVTLFGLAAAMHISRQSKLSPLEASRMLAYSPESRHLIFEAPTPRFDNPFANIAADPNPVPLQQPAAPPAPPAQTAAVAQPAVIEPPTREQPAPAVAPPAPATPDPEFAPVTQPAPAPEAELAPVAQPTRLPPVDDVDTVDERAVVEPPLPRDDEPPAAPANAPAAPTPEPVVTTPEPVAPTAATAPEPTAPAATPIETAPAAPVPAAEQPAVTPDVQQVGSMPAADEIAETRSDVPAVVDAAEAQEPAKARRKRVRKAKAKRPVRRVQAPVASVFANTTSNANRPAQGFWPFD